MLSSEENGLSVVGDICIKDKSSNRDAILKYEDFAKDLPQVDIPAIHHMHGGMYGREITIPKGTVLTGQIYKFDHFDIMISGDITVSTDDAQVIRLKGFNIFKGLSGKKRAGYAHEDTRWITFHPFEGDTGEQIQDEITADSFEELELFYVDVNRNDYLNMVNSIGMSQEEITKQVENTADMRDFPEGYDHLYISKSNIHGSGFFSNNKISDLVAIKNIEANEEITVNYRQVIENRLLEGDLCQE
jgi:hypothetical protein